jgi:hypothetical protein
MEQREEQAKPDLTLRQQEQQKKDLEREQRHQQQKEARDTRLQIMEEQLREQSTKLQEQQEQGELMQGTVTQLQEQIKALQELPPSVRLPELPTQPAQENVSGATAGEGESSNPKSKKKQNITSKPMQPWIACYQLLNGAAAQLCANTHWFGATPDAVVYTVSISPLHTMFKLCHTVLGSPVAC